MKRIVIFLTSIFFLLSANAQQAVTQAVTKIKLSGFNVTLVPSTEFSYEYDKTRSTSEELKKNELKLKANDVKGAANRNQVTINYVTIEQLEFENCEFIYPTLLTLDKLTLKLDKESTVTLELNAKEVNATAKGMSKLNLSGNIKKAKISLDKKSTFNSHALKSDKLSLSASSESTAFASVDASDVDVSLSSSSKLTITGKANKLKAKAKATSVVDANGMQVSKADVESKKGSTIIVKAKELKSNVSQ